MTVASFHQLSAWFDVFFDTFLTMVTWVHNDASLKRYLPQQNILINKEYLLQL